MKFIKIKTYFRIILLKLLFINYYNNNFNYKNFIIKKKYKFKYHFSKIKKKIKKKLKYNKNIKILIIKYINNIKLNFFIQLEDIYLLQYKLYIYFKYNKKIKIYNSNNIKFIKKIYNYILFNNIKLNNIINNKLINWCINRINIINILILKISISEYIIYKLNINIIIHEYKLIIKIFSINKNINFIYGILNNIFKTI
ncbi:MAG: hypothetical protein RDO_1450 [Flavobacteriales endosymbiont of Rhyzopertha dominica]|nr:MAG: hypothetical protein NHG05_00445 [Candidatus Shikimatogenerans bostrichidophilus]